MLPAGLAALDALKSLKRETGTFSYSVGRAKPTSNESRRWNEAAAGMALASANQRGRQGLPAARRFFPRKGAEKRGAAPARRLNRTDRAGWTIG